MGFNNDVFKKATKGLFGLVKDAAMDAVEDAIQDKLDDVLPTSNTTSTKSANNLPKFYEKPVIEEDNKIEKVVYSENMYNNIAPTSAFKKAIHFFNTNAESGIITYQIKEPNRELAVITTFKDMQNDNYVKREEFHYSDGNVRKYYHSKDLYGTNYFDDYYSESMDVQKVDNVVYKFEKEERILFEDILYGLKFTDKTKHRNDDGSYDIRLDLNNENDNKETISMYNRNINSDSKFDIDFANRLDIYASDNYITMHINPNELHYKHKEIKKTLLIQRLFRW